jgi:hypothetical protein
MKTFNKQKNLNIWEAFFTEDGKIDREVETRTQNVNNVNYLFSSILKHPEISIPTKRQIIKSIFFIPTFCYESQTLI